MTSTYQTQCPRCHTIYPMPESKLGEEKARANCGKCHHTFFLNLHLVNPNKPNQDMPNNAGLSAPTHQKDTISEDDMIFDDMDGVTDDTTALNFDGDGLDDFIKKEFESPSTTPPAEDDEAWLDELLKNDDSPAIATTATAYRPRDDLSELIGVDINSYIPEAPTQESPQDILQKVNARLNHTPTQEQLLTKRSPLANLPWLVASVLLVATLGLQYAFFNQDALAKDPSKSSLLSLCGFCGFASADISAFETSYTLSDGAADHSTNFIATLKNNSGKDQLYPNLHIKVMGQAGLIGDLALAPKDYLAVEQRIITPTQDGRFMLTLDTPKDAITSISIEPFY